MSAQVDGPPLGPSGLNPQVSGADFLTRAMETPTVMVSVPSDIQRVEILPPTNNVDEGFDQFEDLGIEPGQVPLVDILDKLDSHALDSKNNFIRLHASDDTEEVMNNATRTISATVNVATLDLTDPDSIHQHLSQLNDTVLKVTTTTGLDLKPIESTSKISNPVLLSPVKISCSSSPPAASSTPHVTLTSNMIPTTSSSNMIPTTSSSNNPAQPKSTTTTGKRSGSGSKSTPQTCFICKKSFSNASALAKHRLTHSEERKYHCNICSKAFKRQDHLNGHLLTHRQTKPYACQIEGCGKSYCDARSLRRHKENHHNNNSRLLNHQKKSNAKVKNDVDNKAAPSQPGGLIVNTTNLSLHQRQIINNLIFDGQDVTPPPTTTSEDMNAELNIPKSEDLSATASSVAAKALAVVQNQAFTLNPLNATPEGEGGGTSQGQKLVLDEKPVECAICNRKFKNIPALNGHMRLHGGYHKKDADGKKIPHVKEHSNFKPLSTTTDKTLARKRKICSRPPEAPALITEIPPPMNKISKMEVLTFKSLPQPNTNLLLANLERSNRGENQSIQLSSIALTPPSQKPIMLPTEPIPNTNVSSSRQHEPELPNVTLEPPQFTSYSATPPGPSMPSFRNVMKVDVDKDNTPKTGVDHQAVISDVLPVEKQRSDKVIEDNELVWDPKVGSRISNNVMQSYLKLASSCLVPGGSRNDEYALQTLLNHSGNVQQSILALMTKPEESKISKHWNETEVEQFYESFNKHHKDFRRLAQDIPTKTELEVVEFYYLWKNLCRHESQSFKTLFLSSSPCSADSPLSLNEISFQSSNFVSNHNNNNNNSNQMLQLKQEDQL